MAKGSHKTLLKIESAPSSGTFNTIGGVQDISGITVSAVVEDVTSHSSNGWEEFCSTGLRQGNTVTFPLIANEPDTEQDLLRSTQAGHAPANFKLVHADGTRMRTFAAIVQNIGESYPVKGVWKREITLQITGEVVFAAAS